MHLLFVPGGGIQIGVAMVWWFGATLKSRGHCPHRERVQGSACYMEFRRPLLGSMLTDTTSPHLALNPLCRVALGSVSGRLHFSKAVSQRQGHSRVLFPCLILSPPHPLPHGTLTGIPISDLINLGI